MPDCFICDRIEQIKKRENPYFVAELETGFVVIGDYQYYKGYSLFLCKQHVSELHHLKPCFKQKFLLEMSLVAQAVYETFKPEKLNYELLGNKDSHLHWHLYPRYKDDPCPEKPSWYISKEIRCNEKTLAKPKELKILVKKLNEKVGDLLNN
jgi:diadenosine tetraphosphate (Ap4A) HIT family hydrolase